MGADQVGRKGVIGVILDEHVIFNSDEETGITHLCNGVDYLFRKLIFSNIRCGISFTIPFTNDKSDLLKQSAIPQSLEYFLFDSSFLQISLQNISESWGSDGGVILFVASGASRDIFHEIHRYGWEIAVVMSTTLESGGSCGKNDDLRVFCMKELEELPLTICKLNRESVVGDDGVTVVGYIMKQVREEEFSKRGALPMCPNESGLIFMPLKFSISMASQLNEVDVVLHKATDEILSVEQNCSFDSGQGIVYTPLMHRFQVEIGSRPDCCVIDRLENVVPVLDRGTIQNMLHGLDCDPLKKGSVIRPPRFLEVSCFAELCSGRRLSDTGLVFPLIVKPRIACGLSDAHSMAIVFGADDFVDLGVPLPAIVQEYVQHSARMFKIYVLGDNVYTVPKNSTPNTSILMKMYERNRHRPLVFDSLRSLPLESGGFGDADRRTEFGIVDIDLVTNVVKYLANKLDLTIFGFDVVVEDGTGDHVIVDINYFPSFKEVPNDVGIPAFWDAIKHRFQKHLRSGGDLWRRKVHS